MKSPPSSLIAAVFLVLGTLSAAAGCSNAPPPVTTASRPPPPEPSDDGPAAHMLSPRLVRMDGQLYVSGLSEFAVLPRSSLLYVQAAQTIAGSSSRPNIGIVKVLESAAPPKVTWYCPPAVLNERDLASQRYRVAPVKPNSTPRLGACFGRFRARANHSWQPNSEVVTVQLNLGSGDGARPNDQYQLLALPTANAIARSITHDVVALCTVQQHTLTDPLVSHCSIDRGAWQDFTRDVWVRGGFAHRLDANHP